MDAEYGRHYRTLYERHWWWRAREAVVLDALRRHGAADRRQRILDIGCGDGLFFDRLAEFGEVEGVEPSRELIDPHGRWASRIHIAPFDEAFAPATRYSIILMLDVLEHLDDPVGALRHAGRLLEPDGLLLITVPAFRALWTHHDVVNHHVTRYTRRSLRAEASRAALALHEERYFFQWTCPVKLAVRAVERLLPPRDGLPAIPGRPVNALLHAISRIEYALLRALPIPFGSSLLVAARPAASHSASAEGSSATRAGAAAA